MLCGHYFLTFSSATVRLNQSDLSVEWGRLRARAVKRNRYGASAATQSSSVGMNHGHVFSFSGNTVLHGAKWP
jgi:hypothetical protein